MDRIDGQVKAAKALDLFLSGFNCAQAVLGAYADECGLRLDDALRVASGFGGGIGGMRGICGALSGSFMVLGMLRGYDDAGDLAVKKQLYAAEQAFTERFRQAFGETHCLKLLELNRVFADSLPAERTPKYYKERPCARYIEWCAAALANELNMEGR